MKHYTTMATKVWTRQAKAEQNALQPHKFPADIPNPPEEASLDLDSLPKQTPLDDATNQNYSLIPSA